MRAAKQNRAILREFTAAYEDKNEQLALGIMNANPDIFPSTASPIPLRVYYESAKAVLGEAVPAQREAQ